MDPISGVIGFLMQESGYFHMQATKPDTLGFALQDSPAGFAVHVLEKFSIWSDKANIGLTEKFTLDELLDNVMVYIISGSVASSFRIYKEFVLSLKEVRLDRIPVPFMVPVAFASFPQEVLRLPKALLMDSYLNLVQYTEMPRGGHCAAFEEPEDIRNFVLRVENKWS